ncbi:hypothetical protein GCM10027614_04950 [Micromonospora vulcania]
MVTRGVTRATAGLLAGIIAAALAAPTPAQAANGTIGQRETVCADDLFVRTEPVGAWMGTLYRGQTFLVEAPAVAATSTGSPTATSTGAAGCRMAGSADQAGLASRA